MNIRKHVIVVGLLGLAGSAAAWSQTPAPGSQPTDPGAASSPHQQQTMRGGEQTMAPTGTGGDPSDASTPHQNDVIKKDADGTKTAKRQAMKDCVSKQIAADSSLSKTKAKKVCHQQMMSQKDSSM